MKKILSLAMAILIAFQTISFVTPNARAETDFPRPAFPDGPEHTNELVDVINANTTNVLIVTEGYGPLTGVSPITEKDFWVDVLADMTGDFDVDWYDGVPSSGLLNSYDLVIYDAGGYWYPLSGGVTEPLEDYHFSGKPLIVVAPDINYDWQGPVPSFCNDVLHIEGVLGIMPESVYDVYADTGHDIVYRIPKDVGIDIPAVTSWPDCFDPKADCDSVLRQGYIPETEFGVGTCSGLPQYSPYDPAGTLFSVVAYSGSETEGRAVTYGVPIAGLENTNIAEQLAEDSIRWCLEEKLVDIDLTLYIEDAVKGKDENAAPVVNKAPGDKVDIIATILNKETDTYSIDVVLEVSSDLSLDKAFTRNGFSDIDEKAVTPVTDGNKRTVTISLEGGKSRQVVLRFEISETASTAVCPLVFARTIVEEVVCSSAITMYNMVDNTKAIIVTNRHLLYEKYDDQEVNSLLRYIYKISDWREENCIVYYVDHYDESLEDWGQDVNYDSETTANAVAGRVDELVEEWSDKLAQKTYWGPFLTSVHYPYLVVVGGDETIPFYRLDDSDYDDSEDDFPYNSNDPVLNAFDENYFLSDNPYADISGDDYEEGELELSVGRIVGHSADAMEFFIRNALSGPEDLDVAIVMHDEEVDDAIDALDEKASVVSQSDSWTDDELEDELEQGFQILYCVSHGEYYEIVAVGGGTLDDDELDDVDSTGGISDNRPLIIFDSCRDGVVTDENGDQWKPEWDDCMVYALVNQGCSGIVASGGLALFDYGIKLTNDYISRLITGNEETLPFGTALCDSKVHYDNGWWWDDGERKTVTEFIYFGLPWTTMDPQGTPPQTASSILINISDPFHVSNDRYAKEIEINVTDYIVSHINSFDLLEIDGAQLAFDEHRPVLPIVDITLLLPLDSNIADIVLVDSITENIGYYNIPSFVSATKPNESSFEPSTGTGFYPYPIYKIETSTTNIHKIVKIKMIPITFNAETKETLLHNYAKLRLTYQTEIPVALQDFVLQKKEYTPGEAIEGLAVIESVTSETLFGIQANVVLRDIHGQVVASASSTPFDLGIGEIKQVSILLDQELPHGTYLLEAGVTGSGTLATSSTYIKILSGGIVDFSAPSGVKSGDDITFEVSFMNGRSEDVYGESIIYLYDTHNIEIASLHSSSMGFPANLITQIQITWSTAGKEYGTYTASPMVYAGGESFGPAYHTFEIKPPDEIPPSTTLTIGEPKHVDPMNNIYVSSTTPFTLTAEDNPGGSGVASTFYRIYNGTYDTDWLEYSAPFYFTGLTDAEYSIDYYSTDNIGNTEATNTATVILDNTPPTTTLTIGEPEYTSIKTYVTPDTPFTLEAADTGSGVYSTAYRIYNATHNSDWQTYTTPFKLTSLAGGDYTIEYNSTDNVQNTETTHTTSVTLFHWNYIYQDTSGRGTTLKINLALKFFQFTAPSKDYGIRKATSMRQCGRAIIISHCDKQLRLITVSVDTKTDFCFAMAWDLQTRKQYLLVDKAGIE
ncbi:hypothetical protein MUP01_12410 [Candidatus Bathyarchaeota archaeon]|nr:hypothetical protein [Candidatus Bathyarchaeota archaeon]